jgi:hypothetical protein
MSGPAAPRRCCPNTAEGWSRLSLVIAHEVLQRAADADESWRALTPIALTLRIRRCRSELDQPADLIDALGPDSQKRSGDTSGAKRRNENEKFRWTLRHVGEHNHAGTGFGWRVVASQNTDKTIWSVLGLTRGPGLARHRCRTSRAELITTHVAGSSPSAVVNGAAGLIIAALIIRGLWDMICCPARPCSHLELHSFPSGSPIKRLGIPQGL